jgi:hypothetical protein
MPRLSPWSAASLVCALACAHAAQGATILERSVTVEIRPDGTVDEREILRVRLDAEADFDTWSPHYIYLDDNRALESLSASVVKPDGKKVDLKRRDLDMVEAVGSGELHSSRKFRTVSFPRVPVGSVLQMDSAVRARPYFPAGKVYLASDDDSVESLRVEVRGAGPGWRWRVDGALPGLDVRETAGGVTLTAHNLPRQKPPDLAPAGADTGATLRYAWGGSEPAGAAGQAGWEGVGRWYDRLVADVPRDAAPVRAKAKELTAGMTGKREQIAALLTFVRRQVRYVAVEVGIGGYRPHTPQEVLDRRWGDCKDKAFLLIDLLREAGIEAWPVLILSAGSDRVDRDFPAPQFNHAIVALSADGLGLALEDPVAGGYLFLDPTQSTGGLGWLHPGAQDQDALVVRGGQGVLVRTPIHQEREKSRLSLDLAVAADGDLAGTAKLELLGESGAVLADFVAAGRPEEVDRVGRQIFGRYLPGVSLEEPRWATDDTGVPSAVLTAKVHLPAPPASASLSSPGGWPSFPLPPLEGMPSPGVLDERELPVVTAPFISEMSWTVALAADACPPAAGQDVNVDNDLGAFTQKISTQGRKLTVERRSELRERWIEPADFPALKEIALAESRTGNRRLRWECK